MYGRESKLRASPIEICVKDANRPAHRAGSRQTVCGGLIDDGELGRVLYPYGSRLNLGKSRADENALWSLGAHDVSVLLRPAGEEPYEVEALQQSLEEIRRNGVAGTIALTGG